MASFSFGIGHGPLCWPSAGAGRLLSTLSAEGDLGFPTAGSGSLANPPCGTDLCDRTVTSARPGPQDLLLNPSPFSLWGILLNSLAGPQGLMAAQPIGATLAWPPRTREPSRNGCSAFGDYLQMNAQNSDAILKWLPRSQAPAWSGYEAPRFHLEMATRNRGPS